MEPEDETRVAVKERIAISPVIASESRLSKNSADLDDDHEKRIFSISPTVKFVMLGYAAAITGAFAIVAIMSLFLPMIGPVVAVVIGLALLLVPAFYHIRKKLVRYTLTETMIEIDRGLISRTTQNIPLRRVQDVTVTASIFQRMLGYGDIEIDNASETNNRIVLDDIDSPKRFAEMILKQMRQLER
jgi:uncharacterized membrane protein YdbT with pleckstrin-like domain